MNGPGWIATKDSFWIRASMGGKKTRDQLTRLLLVGSHSGNELKFVLRY